MQTPYEHAKEAVFHLLCATNCYDGDEAARCLINGLLYDAHKTNQQALFGRVIIPLILKLGQNYREDHCIDDRNRDAAAFCAEMADAIRRKYPQFFREETGDFRGFRMI